jgi:putative endonuclease
MNNYQKGQLYEDKTVDYLLSNQCKLLERNYRRKTGEIDIIMESRNTLLFVEVKYRANKEFGYPSDAVDFYKQKRILKTATWFIKEQQWFEKPIRFDVAIWCDGKLDYYKGAFTYD